MGGPYPINDLERAERFVQELKGEALYIASWKQWVIWDGKHWARDITGGEIMRRAMEIPKILLTEAIGIQDSGQQKKAILSAVQAGNEERLAKMVKLSRSFPEVDKPDTIFDQNPWLIGVQNGVIDLRGNTNQGFRDARLEDYILRKMDVDYDGAATCIPWVDTLEMILPDYEVRSFVHKAIGYSLTGTTSEQIWFFLHGFGQNGKSTFVETILEMFGDYGIKSPAKLFLRDKNGKIPEGSIAQLKGKRFVVGSEVPDDAHLAEGLLKDLASDDKLSGRLLYCNDETFVPTHHLFLAGNVKPVVRSTDLGTWRRLKLLPFEVTIQNRDLEIKKKLLEVKSGILNWMLEGNRQWQVKGLKTPKAVEVATDDYRESEDLIGQFLQEHCDLKPTWISTGDLYAAFKSWSELSGTPSKFIPGIAAFGRKLGRPGIHLKRVGPEKTRGWFGITLKDATKWPKLA